MLPAFQFIGPVVKKQAGEEKVEEIKKKTRRSDLVFCGIQDFQVRPLGTH